MISNKYGISCAIFLFITVFLVPRYLISANQENEQAIELTIESQDSTTPLWKSIWDSARDFQKQKDLVQSKELYRVLLKKKPNLIEARWEYAQLLLSLGMLKEPFIEIERLLELEPNNLIYLMTAGDISLKRKRFNKAINFFGQVYESNPHGDFSDGAIKGLSKGFVGAGKFRSAYILLEQFFQRSKEDNEVLLSLSKLSGQLGDKHKNMYYTELLAERFPEDKKIIQQAAAVFETNGKIKKAIKYWEILVKLDPGDTRIHARLAQYYLRKKLEKQALSHLVAVFENGTDQDRGAFEELPRQIGDIYNFDLGRPDRGLLYYEKYLQKNPGVERVNKVVSDIRYKLAMEYLPIIENDGADHLWDDLSAITTERQLIFLKMADLLEERRMPNHEITLVEILIKESDEKLPLIYRLARLYISQMKIGKGKELIEILERESFQDKSYLLLKSDLEMLQGNEQNALTTLSRYLGYKNNDIDILLKSIDLAGAIGDVQLLTETLGKIVERSNNREEYFRLYLAYIDALRKNGLFEKSNVLYSGLLDIVTEKKKESSDVYFHLADSLLLQGLDFQAEQVVRQVLAKDLSVDASLKKLAQLSLREKRFDQARSWLGLLSQRLEVEEFDESANSLPEDLHFLLIDILVAESEFDEAVEKLLTHKDYKGGCFTSNFQRKTGMYLAKIYFFTEERERCLAILKELFKVDKANQEIVVLESLLMADGALHADNKSNSSFLNYYRQAEYFLEYNNQKLALRRIDRALELIPGSIRARLLKIEVLTLLSRYQEAIKLLTSLPENVKKDEFLQRKKLELDFKSGNFQEIVKNVPLSEQEKEKQKKEGVAPVSDDTHHWRKLLLARALWAQNKRQESIRVYNSLLSLPVDTVFLEKMEVENINFNKSPLKKSFWNVITFTNPTQPDPMATVMDPKFVAQNIGQPIDDIAAGLYGKYRWQKLIKKELSARKAVEERDYYRAEKEYLALLKEEKSQETLFDLANVYNKLGHYGKEAELYEILKKKGPIYPGLDEYIEANVLKRQPRISTSFVNTRRKGRDGYINMKKRTFGLEGWVMPSYDQEVKLGLYRNLYSSFDRKIKSVSNRLVGTYSTYFEDSLDLNVGIGTDNPTDAGSSEILYKFELIGRVSDSVEAYGRFEQDLVEDTMLSVNNSVTQRDFEAGVKYDLIPRWFLGADYRFRTYSDDNEQNRYKLWTMYHLFGEMNQFKIKYSYENIRNNSENVGRSDDNFRNIFRSDDRVYWSPNHYWQHLFTIHYKHLFEISRRPEDPLSYFSIDYSYGYEEDFNQVHGFDFNIFLEMDRHFLLKGNVNTTNGNDYEDTYAAFSLIYRW